MQFEFGGNKWRIWFQHTKHDGKRETLAFVDIAQSDPQFTDDRATFAAGWSLCAAADPFRKETGRKLALTRALKSTSVYERFGIDKMKLFRAAAWACYLNRANSEIRKNAGGA